jgi:hypothetical protein
MATVAAPRATSARPTDAGAVAAPLGEVEFTDTLLESIQARLLDELGAVQRAKAETDVALRDALSRRGGAAHTGGSDAAFLDAGMAVPLPKAGPLKGAARAAWERAIVEDEMAQPLMVEPETMHKWREEEEAAEKRLAAELALHMSQIKALRSKLETREAAARQATAGGGKRKASASPSRAASARGGSPDRGGGGDEGLGPKPSLAATTTSHVGASLDRLDVLERRIAQLEASMMTDGLDGAGAVAGGAGSIWAGPAAFASADEPPTAAVHELAAAADGGTGAAPTPSLYDAATSAGVPLGVALLAQMSKRGPPGGGGRGAPVARAASVSPAPSMDSRYSAAKPRPSAISGGARSLAADRSISGGGAGVGAGASVMSRTMAGGSVAASAMPSVASAPLLGMVFKKEVVRTTPLAAAKTLYAVHVVPSTVASGRGGLSASTSLPSLPSLYSPGLSAHMQPRAPGRTTSSSTTFPLTSVPEAPEERNGGDGREAAGDAIDAWLDMKRRQVNALLAPAHGTHSTGPMPSATAPGRGRAPGGHSASAASLPSLPSGNAAASRRGVHPVVAYSPLAAPPPGLQGGHNAASSQQRLPRVGGGGGSGSMVRVVEAQRAKASQVRHGGVTMAGGAGVAAMREGTRTAVRNATLNEFTDIRRGFEAQRSALRGTLRQEGNRYGAPAAPPAAGASSLPRGAPGGGGGGAPRGGKPVRSVGFGSSTNRSAPAVGGPTGGGRALPPGHATRRPAPPVGMSRSASVPARLAGGGGGQAVAARGPPRPSPSPAPSRSPSPVPAPAAHRAPSAASASVPRGRSPAPHAVTAARRAPGAVAAGAGRASPAPPHAAVARGASLPPGRVGGGGARR